MHRRLINTKAIQSAIDEFLDIIITVFKEIEEGCSKENLMPHYQKAIKFMCYNGFVAGLEGKKEGHALKKFIEIIENSGKFNRFIILSVTENRTYLKFKVKFFKQYSNQVWEVKYNLPSRVNGNGGIHNLDFLSND